MIRSGKDYPILLSNMIQYVIFWGYRDLVCDIFLSSIIGG